MKKHSKRFKIRVVSFLCTFIVCLSVCSVVCYKGYKTEKNRILIWQQSSLSSLATYIDTIKTDLYKGLYACTPKMTGKLSASLLQCSSASLECLQRLPSGTNGLNNIYKFLTQVGNFTESLNNKVVSDGKISDEDYKNMQSLFKYASDLSTQIDYMQEVMLCGNVDFEDVKSTISVKDEDTDLNLSYTDTIDGAEESFTDFPTLIYDGPFSDDILSKESELLKTKQEISQNKAKTKCGEYLSLKTDDLAYKYDEKSNCSAYVFSVVNSGKQTTAAITKNGGYLSYIISDTNAGDSKYNETEAVNAGLKFLEKCGYKNMVSTYYSVSDGICTVNYAYKFNDIVCYSDLIKVGISLSDCSITSFDARTYLINHTERKLSENIISVDKAMESVSKNLSINSYKKAIIPSDNNSEYYCYEFACTGDDGDDVLVYIDTSTGQEDEILILLHTDGGILTK